jgi:hypothetical protein
MSTKSKDKKAKSQLPPHAWSEEQWQDKTLLCCGFCGYSTLEGGEVIGAHVRERHPDRLIQPKEE